MQSIQVYYFQIDTVNYTPQTVVTTITSGDDYHYGFNGKYKDNEWAGLGNHIDYGFRGYDPRIARFNSIDPLTKKYPMLTPYQFGSNSPISGVDLDGLEYYFASDGRYIGVADKNNTTVRVISAADAKAYSKNVTAIHAAVAAKKLGFVSPQMTTEKVGADGKKTFEKTDLTIEVLMNNVHTMYGEAGAKTSEYLKLAHLLNNREIKFAKRIAKIRSEPYGWKKYYDQDDAKVPLLKYNAKYGFNKYVSYGVFMPYNETALGDYKKTLESTGIQIDQGVQNSNYFNFFTYKFDIAQLQVKIPQTINAVKEVIDARTGTSTDPNPNMDGWRGVNGVNKPRNDMPGQKSD